MTNISEVIKGRVVDVYDGDINTANSLAHNGADHTTLFQRTKNVTAVAGKVSVKPYGALLEAADCVADVCLLDNNAIKVLVAMYPSVPTNVLLRFAIRRSWFLGSLGLLRRLIFGLVRFDGLVTLTDEYGKTTRWVSIKQKGMAASRPPVLPGSIGVRQFLSWLKAQEIDYVVLRFFEKLPNLYRDAGDIDILLSAEGKLRVMKFLKDNEGQLAGVSKDIRLGLHSASGEQGSIPYYPPLLARQILDRAMDGPAGSRIPCPEDALNSFVYHALYHAKKGYAAGIPSSLKRHTELHPENDYAGVIREMAHAAGSAPGSTMEELDEYLASKGWRPKLDTLAKLGETNAWVYDRFFTHGHVGPAGLAVFMLREWVYEKGLYKQAEDIIISNGFTILRSKVLSSSEKKAATEVLRGGNWGANEDGSNDGWLPAVALVVVDKKCVKMLPAYAKGYEHFKIRALKNALREAFDTDEMGSVHSTDNSHESWEYIDICFGGEATAIKSEFERFAEVFWFSKLFAFLTPTYIRHALRYSLREFMIRRFLG